ncbi:MULTISPECIES: hypothetical protein [Streptomyces]|uniref:hypothetical protein n=1 Tax=Streptomyces TaxID=1883 RepID=UPI0036449FE8
MEELEKLGMVWSHHDVAWEEGLTAARGWAKEDGHLLGSVRPIMWLVLYRSDPGGGEGHKEAPGRRILGALAW